MASFWLPTQKGTRLFPAQMAHPPVVRIVGPYAKSIEAQAILKQEHSKIEQFVNAQRRMYSLSVGDSSKKRLNLDNINMVYQNQFGQEIITLEPKPVFVNPLEPREPDKETNIPTLTEFGGYIYIDMVVLFGDIPLRPHNIDFQLNGVASQWVGEIFNYDNFGNTTANRGLMTFGGNALKFHSFADANVDYKLLPKIIPKLLNKSNKAKQLPLYVPYWYGNGDAEQHFPANAMMMDVDAITGKRKIALESTTDLTSSSSLDRNLDNLTLDMKYRDISASPLNQNGVNTIRIGPASGYDPNSVPSGLNAVRGSISIEFFSRKMYRPVDVSWSGLPAIVNDTSKVLYFTFNTNDGTNEQTSHVEWTFDLSADGSNGADFWLEDGFIPEQLE